MEEQYHTKEDFVNLDLARQSQMDTTEEHHSRLGKGDEECSFGKVAASKNSQKLSGCGIRLSKLLSERGICSRREADRYIERGEVLVDGEVVNVLGTKVSPDSDIRLIPRARKQQANKVTILLNKPVGYVSTQPEKGYKAAIELLPPKYRKMNTAGRLDIESKGLLIFTEDGTVVKKIIGETARMEKEYLVRVSGKITEGKLETLRFGLSLDDKPLKPAQIDRLEDQILRFVLTEGKKRQIRRMCEQVDLRVVGLKRVRIGNIRLGNLPEGKWRILQPSESF